MSGFEHIRFARAASASVRLLQSFGDLAAVPMTDFKHDAAENVFCLAVPARSCCEARAIDSRLQRHRSFGRNRRFLSGSVIEREDDGGVLLTFPHLTGIADIPPAFWNTSPMH